MLIVNLLYSCGGREFWKIVSQISFLRLLRFLLRKNANMPSGCEELLSDFQDITKGTLWRFSQETDYPSVRLFLAKAFCAIN